MTAEDLVLTLTASSYCDIAKHSKVINTKELDYFLWIYLNPDQVRDAYLLDACEVVKDGQYTPLIFRDTFERSSTSWIQVRTDHINKQIGLHIYRFNFINHITDLTFSLYASYIIQNEDEIKPYIYMNR